MPFPPLFPKFFFLVDYIGKDHETFTFPGLDGFHTLHLLTGYHFYGLN